MPTKKETAKQSSSRAKPKAKRVPRSSKALFAVIETGGKQYKVFKDDTISIDTVVSAKGKKEGAKIIFDKVLLVDNGKDTQIGDPYLKGAKVEATLEEEGRGKKIDVIRFKAKSRYLKKKGHRQPYMKVKITAIK